MDHLVRPVSEKTTTTPTTTTTTSTTTKNPKDDYTYEYVYEDELDKGKGFKKEKSEPGQKHRRKGATSDEYTYEYIYEDEMKKSKRKLNRLQGLIPRKYGKGRNTLEESQRCSSKFSHYIVDCRRFRSGEPHYHHLT